MSELEIESSRDLSDSDIDKIINRPISRKPITIYEAPEFVSRLGPYREAAGGDAVSFEVEVRGLPAPEVKWYKNDDLVQETIRHKFETEIKGHVILSRLSISDVGGADEGAYKCKAENKEGVASTTGYLSVTGRKKTSKPSSPSNSPKSNTSGSTKNSATSSSTSSGGMAKNQPMKRSDRPSTPCSLRPIVEQSSMEDREAEECDKQGPSPIQDFIDVVHRRKRKFSSKRAKPLIFCPDSFFTEDTSGSSNFEEDDDDAFGMESDSTISPPSTPKIRPPPNEKMPPSLIPDPPKVSSIVPSLNGIESEFPKSPKLPDFIRINEHAENASAIPNLSNFPMCNGKDVADSDKASTLKAQIIKNQVRLTQKASTSQSEQLQTENQSNSINSKPLEKSALSQSTNQSQMFISTEPIMPDMTSSSSMQEEQVTRLLLPVSSRQNDDSDYDSDTTTPASTPEVDFFLQSITSSSSSYNPDYRSPNQLTLTVAKDNDQSTQRSSLLMRRSRLQSENMTRTIEERTTKRTPSPIRFTIQTSARHKPDTVVAAAGVSKSELLPKQEVATATAVSKSELLPQTSGVQNSIDNETRTREENQKEIQAKLGTYKQTGADVHPDPLSQPSTSAAMPSSSTTSSSSSSSSSSSIKFTATLQISPSRLTQKPSINSQDTPTQRRASFTINTGSSHQHQSNEIKKNSANEKEIINPTINQITAIHNQLIQPTNQIEAIHKPANQLSDDSLRHNHLMDAIFDEFLNVRNVQFYLVFITLSSAVCIAVTGRVSHPLALLLFVTVLVVLGREVLRPRVTSLLRRWPSTPAHLEHRLRPS